DRDCPQPSLAPGRALRGSGRGCPTRTLKARRRPQPPRPYLDDHSPNGSGGLGREDKGTGRQEDGRG
ncbi:MAG: hypothetical protein PHF37_06465, partial [Phycisphaerae bacterium]|nr:hypothetical protein [Phycisphaerae bacterium]